MQLHSLPTHTHAYTHCENLLKIPTQGATGLSKRRHKIYTTIAHIVLQPKNKDYSATNKMKMSLSLEK